MLLKTLERFHIYRFRLFRKCFQIGEETSLIKEFSKEQIEKKATESTNRKQRRDNKEPFNQLLDEAIEKSAG